MDTDRKHVTYGKHEKDFIVHKILEAKWLAFLCPGSLRPNFYKGQLERVKRHLLTQWVSLQERNPEVTLLGSHMRTASLPMLFSIGKTVFLSSKAIDYTNILENTVQHKGKNFSADKVYGNERDPWGILSQQLMPV